MVHCLVWLRILTALMLVAGVDDELIHGHVTCIVKVSVFRKDEYFDESEEVEENDEEINL